MTSPAYYLSGTYNLPLEVFNRRLFFLTQPLGEPDVRPMIDMGKFRVLPKKWSDRGKYREIQQYLEDAYLRFIRLMTPTLNEIHQRDFPSVFWEILTGAWLTHFLHVVYDRFDRIRTAIEMCNGAEVVMLSFSGNCSIRGGHREFLDKTSYVEEDVSRFYGRIAEVMGLPVSRIEPASSTPKEKKEQGNQERKAAQPLGRKIFGQLKREMVAFLRSCRYRNGSVLVCSEMFGSEDRDMLSKACGAVVFPKKIAIHKKTKPVDRSLLGSFTAEDRFEEIVLSLLPEMFPTFLLEEMDSWIDAAIPWNRFRVYFSETAWYANRLFSFAAALGKLKGAQLVGCQHGGGYGQAEFNYHELMERRICDKFVTWGWKDSRYPGSELVPLPPPRYAELENAHSERENTLLWAGLTMKKQVVRFINRAPDAIEDYLDCKSELLHGIDPTIRSHIVYRPHRADLGWRMDEEAIFEPFPEVRIDKSGKIIDQLARVRMFVCDHQSTSFLECFMANTPMVLIWMKQWIDERMEAAPYFDRLRDAGILFHDPVKAAEMINDIWDDVPGWWNAPERKEAVEIFRRWYCLTDTQWKRQWIEFFQATMKKKK